jgi:outer membrane protein assembly factor BamB
MGPSSRNIAVLFFAVFAGTTNAQTLDWRVDLGATNVNQLHVTDAFAFTHGPQSLARLDTKSGNSEGEVSLLSATERNPTNLISFEKKSTTHYMISSYDNGDVVAYDTRLDNVMWSLHHIASKPVIDWKFGVGVYMLTEAGKLLAVDSMSGFLVWAIDIDGFSPECELHLSLDNERLFVLSPGGQLQIYSAQDGSHLADSYFEGMEKTVLVGDFLYFYRAGSIEVFHVNDSSTQLWKSDELGSLHKVTPMEDNKHVLLQTSTGLHKVKNWNGKLKWSFEPTMDIVSLVTEGDAIYAVLELLEPTFLIKLDSKTGAKEWTYFLEGEAIVGDIRVRDEAVYILTAASVDDAPSSSSSSTHLIKLDASDSYQLQVGEAVYQ